MERNLLQTSVRVICSHKNIVESGKVVSDIEELNSLGMVELISASSHRKPHIAGNPVTTYILKGVFDFIRGPWWLFHEDRSIKINSKESCDKLAYVDNIHSVSYQNFWDNEKGNFLSRELNIKINRLPPKKFCNIITCWSQNNIYHSLYDSFSKLEVMSRLDDIKNYTYLVPENARFLVALLKEAGLPVMEYKPNRIYRGEMYVPSMPGAVGYTPYSVFNFLRKKFIHVKGPKKDSIIYITRKNSRKRRIVNEDSFIKKLKSKYAIEVLELENMTIHEQICAFKESKCVIGPHGAGLSWIAFMNGGNVIEIDSPSYTNRCFSTISRNNRKIEHHVLTGQHSSSSNQISQDDFEVNIDKIINEIENIISRS